MTEIVYTENYIVENVFPDNDFDQEVECFMENVGKALLSFDKRKTQDIILKQK